MKVSYDIQLDLATGLSRKTKVWRNKPIMWSELLDRLSTTTRTPESVAEYRAMSKDAQSEIKDVGGYVGGYCNNGSRSDVRHRSLICLDADFADGDLWPDWLLAYGNAAACHSTHKHTPEKPRIRLIIPIRRAVTPDEYQAVARRIAGTLGIDKFDDTTYQAQRLMHWPSTSRDGEWVFESCDGPILDPDEVLATYHDWRDMSSWPMSSRVAEVAKKAAARQKDPLEKGGVVGAFCRAFTIEEAINRFIPEYAPCAEPNRYTYTGGSTAGGVVIYDHKFAFSHHATDPASEQLCNAFDLVRLHQYGARDDGIDPDKPTTDRPSYKAMVEMASGLPEVRRQIVTDHVAEAEADFGEETDTDAPTEEKPVDWYSTLRMTAQGGIAQTIDNLKIILRNDARLRGAIALNEMTHATVARRSLPWRQVTGASQWTDTDDAGLRHYLEKTYGLSGKDKIFDAVNLVALENAYHPVRDYLNSLTWDGTPRADTLLIDYLGAEDSPYTRAVTRKTLTAAVARVMQPGCKFDYMLTLRGRQGLGKSALIAKLGGEWFSDSFSTLQGKDAYEQVLGVWLMEVGELAGMKKAEAETIKLYISKQTDRFRPAYGRRTEEFPRQCVFIGTTNEAQFLRDTTGNRRFWVVDLPNRPARSLWDDLTPDVVGQVWAEALAIYKRGEPLYLSRELESVAASIQDAYEEENPRIGIVSAYLDRLLPEDWPDKDIFARRQWLESDAEGTVHRTTVCTLEVWVEALGGNPEKIDRYAAKEIRDIMDSLPGWKHSGSRMRTFKLYGRQKFFERKETQ